MSDRLIKSKEVTQLCGGIHTMTLSRWIKERGFPMPCMVIGRIRHWREGDVAAWLEAQENVV